MRQLIVIIDALGWLTAERLEVLAGELPFRRRLTTVFGYSSTAIPSLLTGAAPSEHGHWFLYKRALDRRPFALAGWIDRLPGNPGRRWRVRMRLQEFWRRRAGISGYFSLYDVPLRVLADLAPVEIEDTWAPHAFPDTPSIVDVLATGGRSYHVSDWRVPDAEKIRRAEAALDAGEPEVVLLYLTEVDAAQHRYGTRHEAFETKVRDTAAAVKRVWARMQRNGPVGLSVASDHGMTDVRDHRDVLGHLEKAGLRRGRDFDGFFDSTVARFWNIRDLPGLREALDALPGGRVLDPGTLEEWGVRFPRGEYGDVFFLVDPGVLILPSDMGSTAIAAMHGYDPAHPTSDACFLADRELPLRSEHLTAVFPLWKRRIEDGI